MGLWGDVLFTLSLTSFFASMVPRYSREKVRPGSMFLSRIPQLERGIAESAYIHMWGPFFLFTTGGYCRWGLVGAGRWAGGNRHQEVADSSVPGEFVVLEGGESHVRYPCLLT